MENCSRVSQTVAKETRSCDPAAAIRMVSLKLGWILIGDASWCTKRLVEYPSLCAWPQLGRRNFRQKRTPGTLFVVRTEASGSPRRTPIGKKEREQLLLEEFRKSGCTFPKGVVRRGEDREGRDRGTDSNGTETNDLHKP